MRSFCIEMEWLSLAGQTDLMLKKVAADGEREVLWGGVAPGRTSFPVK
jgi:hypothetical protein